jgi:hypothetical protein
MANDVVIAKDVYKKQCEEHLAQKRKDIEVLNQKLKTLVPGSAEYQQCKIDLAKAEKKAKEYIQSIYIMDVQMNAKTHARFMGIPMIPNVK